MQMFLLVYYWYQWKDTASVSMHYEQYIMLYCAHINCYQSCIGDKVFKNGPSEFCEKQPLKNLKWYGLPEQTISVQVF